MIEPLHRWQGPLGALIALAVVLPGLGTSGLLDPWEMDRAAVARLISGTPQVLVIDEDGELLARLDKETAGRVALRRIPTVGEGAAATALSRAANELSERVHHAVIIDADAVISGRPGQDGADHLAARLDALASGNRGTLVALVSGRDHDDLRRTLATARAKLWQASYRGGWWEHALPSAAEAHKLWPMTLRDEVVWHPDDVADGLLTGCPSPWTMVQHKANGASAQAPLLDSWLVAASMRALGPSEWSARLPGALVLALITWLAVTAAGALYGPAGGWLTLLVLLTMPLAIGSARTVTLAHTASLGTALVALGLALGAAKRGRWWWLAVLFGLDVLLLGRGLGGLAIGAAIIVGYVVASADMRRSMLGLAAFALLALGVAATIVLTDDESPILRALRFTQVPFSGGLPDGRRDLAELISHLGFGLYPWGPVFLIGCGRMLFSSNSERRASRRDIALIIGFGAPLLGAAILLPGFGHVTLPVAPLVAVITAALLLEVLAGRASGTVLALLVIVPALLLHREIGKDAGTLVRWLAFDPPLGDDKSAFTWPSELSLHKGLRRAALILTVGFALALAQPLKSAISMLGTLQARRAALWATSTLAIAYVLDVLISAGTRLDVLLRAEAQRTGYLYDRAWTTIQMTRPEVIAGAAVFVALLVGCVLLDVSRGRDWGRRRWARLLQLVARPFSNRWVALGALAAAAIGLLANGLIVMTAVQKTTVGDALLEGLTSAAFIAPVALAVIISLLARLPSWLGGQFEWAQADRDTSFARLLRAAQGSGWFGFATLALIALGGIGVGASQVAGTWTYGFLAAAWGLAIAVVLTVGAQAERSVDSWASAALAAAIIVATGVWAVLMGRLLGEPNGPGLRYIARVLVLAPDTLLLLLAIGMLVVNRLAVRHGPIALGRRLVLAGATMVQRPGSAVGLLGLAALMLAGGYAHGLLPGMSLHFSQKHLLARVDEVGGTIDERGVPRTYKHATGGRSSIQTNFYTRSMPTIADRDAVLSLLAGHDVGTRVSDYGDLGRSLDLAIAGWCDENDEDKDGKRDKAAWFGVAQKVDGLSVVAAVPGAGEEGAAPPRWKADEWKGAKLRPSNGHPITVLGNSGDTLRLAAPTSLIAGDIARGAFSLDHGDPDKMSRCSAASAGARFVVLAKEQFSELNHLFRARHGRHISVLDARSSRLVLAASRLPSSIKDDNWLQRAVYTDAQLAKMPGLTKVSINWDNRMELVAYHLASKSVRRSQKYKLTLYLKIHNKLQHSYKLFMHPHPLHRDLWPLAYKRASKATEKRCSGCFQTDHWRPGDIVAFPIEQEVPLGTNAGPQDVILGWYDPLSDKRLALNAARGPGVIRHRDNRVTLTKLQIR